VDTDTGTDPAGPAWRWSKRARESKKRVEAAAIGGRAWAWLYLLF